ncbi:MAG: helicase [Nitrospinaceae bacterium]|nr:helicase [Nitrospinaceae bacterium]NIR57064.1 helicase [Nitrospinaceae bacterium]NIT84375.1 helicase [Nitrospinaceae bacterium]NIU46562.1 helicase [Nitrospinaceae bacterium]NIU98754.1 helicase [Nitrospinaceae bacterium]
MPKLKRFKIQIDTGRTGTGEPVFFTINNHKLPLEDTRGKVQPGETFEGGFEIGSFVHSLTLVGPETGKWDIRKVQLDFECENTDPYSIVLGEVTLDPETELNIWREPPLPTWDV